MDKKDGFFGRKGAGQTANNVHTVKTYSAQETQTTSDSLANVAKLKASGLINEDEFTIFKSEVMSGKLVVKPEVVTIIQKAILDNKNLHQQGLLTDEEFDQLRAKAIKDLIM